MAEDMHPAKGSGRDSDSQKNLLRKVINTLNKSSEKAELGAVHISETVTDKVDELIGVYVKTNAKDEKKENSKKGDAAEEKKERMTVFQTLLNLPEALKTAAGSAKDKGSNLMSSLGKKVKGFTGMLGKLAMGAGAGILAIVAVAGLMSSGIIDAEKVKKSVLTLLSIGDEMSMKGLATLAFFSPAMKRLGTGLAFFGAGSAIAGMSNALLEKFGAGNWAQGVKDNVLTLLSIGDSVGLTDIATLLAFQPAMIALATGLAAFGAGSAVAGMSDALLKKFGSGGWAETTKQNVLTLLSIGDELTAPRILAIAAVPVALIALGGGLAVFGAGSGIASMTTSTVWADNVKSAVLTLLSIPDEAGGNIGMLASGGTVALALGGIGAGLLLFGAGSAINSLVQDTKWSGRVKTNVLTLLSIADDVGDDFVKKSTSVATGLGKLGAGLAVFGGGTFVSSLAAAASGILDFFTPGKSLSPVDVMLSLADREVEINKAATGVTKLANAMSKLSGISFNGNNIDIEGMLNDFGHLPALLDGLANGSPNGPIEFETHGRNKHIDFKKGILDPSLKVPEIAATMNHVNSVLGLGTPRNSTQQATSSENAEMKSASSGGTVAVNTGGNTTNNTSSSSAVAVVDASPATDDLDRVA